MSPSARPATTPSGKKIAATTLDSVITNSARLPQRVGDHRAGPLRSSSQALRAVPEGLAGAAARSAASAHRSPPRASQSRPAPSRASIVPRTTPSASAPPPRARGRDDHRHAEQHDDPAHHAGGGGVGASHAAAFGEAPSTLEESMITRAGRSWSTVSSVRPKIEAPVRPRGQRHNDGAGADLPGVLDDPPPGLPGPHLLPVPGHAPSAENPPMEQHRPRRDFRCRSWLVSAAKPLTKPVYPKRHVWLETALMSREMDRL